MSTSITEKTLTTFTAICEFTSELQNNKIPHQIHFDENNNAMLLVECLTSSDGFVKLLTSEYSVPKYIFDYLVSKTLDYNSIVQSVMNIEAEFTTIEFESNRLAELAFNINKKNGINNKYIDLWVKSMDTCNTELGTKSAVVCIELFTQFNEIFTKLNNRYI